ncbi:hypothetical protein TIFTF001_020079 [Ficus carica]|uniref:Uncharacterized protein n=1 Tax=Ficus carica TaxID=3494 RepID=A0AA88AEQ1_FICCA|nr:hypothetical protein TIFTF001_020079 [Ficus carica]
MIGEIESKHSGLGSEELEASSSFSLNSSGSSCTGASRLVDAIKGALRRTLKNWMVDTQTQEWSLGLWAQQRYWASFRVSLVKPTWGWTTYGQMG